MHGTQCVCQYVNMHEMRYVKNAADNIILHAQHLQL